MDFQSDVIDKSNDLPILVDFWAPWCGPCRFIGPILEDLDKATDEWKLVKVNVDENQDLAAQFHVRGIPAVKLFHKSEVIAEFGGAMPKAAVEKWLDEHLPSASKDLLDQIISESAVVPSESAIKKIEDFLKEDPTNKKAKYHLARHMIFVKPEETIGLIDDFKIGEEFYDEADHIQKIYQFLDYQVIGESEMNQIIKKAQEQFKSGKISQCVETIIRANRIDKNFHHDLPRKTAIALFETLGKQHKVTKKYRSLFNMALY